MSPLDVRLEAAPIDVPRCLAFVQGPGQGAIVLFLGQVRDATGERAVTRLDYEAYPTMALSEMEALARTALEQHGAARVSLVHRTGELAIGETAVAIAVSAGHRPAAFAACRWLIDTLKQRVPIWKKEWYDDGSAWIAEHP